MRPPGPRAERRRLCVTSGKRIGLVHELGKLRSSENSLENRGHRLGIDQVMRHERGNFLQAHPLLDCPFHAHKADAVLVFHQFANQAHAAVAKMIDVVGRPVAVLEIHQDLDGRQNILVCQNAGFPSFSFRSRRWLSLVAANWRDRNNPDCGRGCRKKLAAISGVGGDDGRRRR